MCRLWGRILLKCDEIAGLDQEPNEVSVRKGHNAHAWKNRLQYMYLGDAIVNCITMITDCIAVVTV